MRRLPVAAGALTLFDDLPDGRVGRFQAGNGDELRPPEDVRCGLGTRWPDEQGLFAETGGQMGQPVQMPR